MISSFFYYIFNKFIYNLNFVKTTSTMTLKRTILLSIILFIYSHTNAAHIIGGEVTYECLGFNQATNSNNYRVTLSMYRDATGGGAQFDNPAFIGVFQQGSSVGDWIFINRLNINHQDIITVPYGSDCVEELPNLVVQKATYSFEVSLPISDKPYQIAYQRCCRNNTISNIVNPGATGDAFTVIIKSEQSSTCNSSPVFDNYPPVLICAGKPLHFDHSASDQNGDSLVYEFCNPISAGGTDGATTPGDPNSCTGVIPFPDNCPPPYAEIQFLPQYSVQNPMGGNPQVTINPKTGLISGTPNMVGQFVVGVCANEYRDSILIGSIRRDFQFNVRACQNVSDTLSYAICPNDSIIVNDQVFKSGGTFTQNLETAIGCDSTLYILITQKENTTSTFEASFCQGSSIVVNGTSYSVGGVYTQMLTNAAECDSTIIINLEEIPTTNGQLDYTLCTDEEIIVNGQIYTEAGIFTQTLQNAIGCDSMLQINISEGEVSSVSFYYSLCNGDNYEVNGIKYELAGQYNQILTSSTGCDSIINIFIAPCDGSIYYDLEQCDASTPEQGMDYMEFLPSDVVQPSCGQIEGGNIHRINPDENKHSCSSGHESPLSMCVSTSPTCDLDSVDRTPISIEFEVVATDSTFINFNHLIFQQKGPEMFSWVSGNSGINNFPTKYAIRILKDSVEVFSKTDVPATTVWQEEKYDFFDNTLFHVSGTSKFTIELTPYCSIGNSGKVSVWDIDDVTIYLSCNNKVTRKISGKIVNMNSLLDDTYLIRKGGDKAVRKKITQAGTFNITNNDVNHAYEFSMFNDNNPNKGVSTYDLVLVQKHLLGIKMFTSPLEYIAADVNNDQRISAADLIELRRIILGISTTFKNVDSWKFVDESKILPGINPWEINDYIKVMPDHNDVNNLQFKAIKMGDIDGALKGYN